MLEGVDQDSPDSWKWRPRRVAVLLARKTSAPPMRLWNVDQRQESTERRTTPVLFVIRALGSRERILSVLRDAPRLLDNLA